MSEQETSETQARSEVFLLNNFIENTGIHFRKGANCVGNTTSGTSMLYNFHQHIYTLSSKSGGLSGWGGGRGEGEEI